MPVLSENLLAYYQCDAAAPDADSWGSNTATLYSIGSDPGQFNEAWTFSNSYDSANTGTITTSGTYTLSGWAYNLRVGWSAFATNNASGTSENWYMALNTGTDELGVWANSTFQGSGYSADPATLSGWHHYATTRDASTGEVKFYIDGAQVGATITPTMPGVMRMVYIGGDPGGSDYRWGERLDDYAIWGRALALDEIANIYTQGIASNSLRSLIGPSTLRGMFSSVVHTVAPENARLHGAFGSIVHSVASENDRLHGMFMSVIHNDIEAGGGGGVLPPIQGQAAQGNTVQGLLNPKIQGS